MGLRVLCLLLFAVGARCQWYDFCKTGIPKANFTEDAGEPSIDVILAVAPLFSTNPKIGGALGMYGLYHTALVLAQGNGTARRYWTLEFDYAKGSVVNGAVPAINGSQLVWDDDIRYCLTDGLLWGREHWKKQFDTVMTINKEQAERVFNEVVIPVNTTAPGNFPQYQLWRVIQKPSVKIGREVTGNRKEHVLNLNTLIGDVTCSDGMNWILHYIIDELGVPAYPKFQYRGTTIWVSARRIEPANVSDPEVWQDILDYYGDQNAVLGRAGNYTIFDRFMKAATKWFPMRYIHNANTNTYFKVIGNNPPYVHIEYAPSLLVAAPTAGNQTQRLSVVQEHTA